MSALVIGCDNENDNGPIGVYQFTDSPVDAVRTTLKTTGGSLFGSAFTTMAGFGILMTSSLKPFQQMGQVVVVALGFALVASILILPTLLVFWANYHNKKTAKSL